MIVVGLDDTDIADSPGTNQIARAIVAHLGPGATGAVIVRHQLLFDRRVPYTSKNGSASILLPAASGNAAPITELTSSIRGVMRSRFVTGSDPGLAIAIRVTATVEAFGRRCQREIVTRADAHSVAGANGVHLEGLGGTEDGVIGALAAVGLASTGDDGRVVHLDGWPYPDDFGGPQDVAAIKARGIDDIRRIDTNEPVEGGLVDVGKRLRPNRRSHKVVLLVEAVAADTVGGIAWRAVKLP